MVYVRLWDMGSVLGVPPTKCGNVMRGSGSGRCQYDRKSGAGEQSSSYYC